VRMRSCILKTPLCPPPGSAIQLSICVPSRPTATVATMICCRAQGSRGNLSPPMLGWQRPSSESPVPLERQPISILVDTMLCVNASMLSRRESIQMSHNPDMRAHVTDKITNTPHMPMYEPKLTRWPTRERWGVGILRWEGGCSIPCVPCGQQAQGALLGAQSREQLARQHTDCTSGADFTAVHSTG
jgi:hypothetical protein